MSFLPLLLQNIPCEIYRVSTNSLDNFINSLKNFKCYQNNFFAY